MDAREVIANQFMMSRAAEGEELVHSLGDYDDADDLIAALTKTGYVIVPAEPTEAMIKRGASAIEHEAISNELGWDGEEDIPFDGEAIAGYRAMLAVSEEKLDLTDITVRRQLVADKVEHSPAVKDWARTPAANDAYFASEPKDKIIR